jgi:hypothetical protein
MIEKPRIIKEETPVDALQARLKEVLDRYARGEKLNPEDRNFMYEMIEGGDEKDDATYRGPNAEYR